MNKFGVDSFIWTEIFFDPSFEELAGNCAIWRKFAESGEALAIEGLANLKKMAAGVWK